MTFVVRFLNPTANKALHLGHLRNAVIGDALCCHLRAIGAKTFRHVLVEDVGIFLAEAYLASFVGGDQELRGGKADQRIGKAYAAYRNGDIAKSVIEDRARQAGIAADPKSFAVKLLDKTTKEAACAAHIRDAVMVGQAATLARLGISFDAFNFESNEIPFLYETLEKIIDIGQQHQGLFGRPGLRLSTGRYIDLFDAADVPSEHAILLTHISRHIASVPGIRYFAIAGRDWAGQLDGYADLLSPAFPGIDFSCYTPLFTGMVSLEGRPMSSRTAHFLLIDSALDVIQNAVISKLGRPASQQHLDWLGSIVLKAPFLARPSEMPIEISLEGICDTGANEGWIIAEAVSRFIDTGFPLSHISEELNSPGFRTLWDTADAGIDFSSALKFTVETAKRLMQASGGDLSELELALTACLLRLGVRPPIPPENVWGGSDLITLLKA